MDLFIIDPPKLFGIIILLILILSLMWTEGVYPTTSNYPLEFFWKMTFPSEPPAKDFPFALGRAVSDYDAANLANFILLSISILN